jgi:hypothetical protein
MSSYFDAKSRALAEVAGADDETFLANLEAIEAALIADVNLATGDREFPDDLRERIQGLIATCRAFDPPGFAGSANPRMKEKATTVVVGLKETIMLRDALRELLDTYAPLTDGSTSEHPATAKARAALAAAGGEA